MEIAMEQEEEDIQNDPVRRQHFDYNEYSTLVNGHPDIFLDSEGNQIANLDFAPGEGKKPVNFLDVKDLDIKTWPTLLPDGKFGLSHKRPVKLTKQNYFQQRLLNVDDRFARTPNFLFTSMSVVEADRLRSNANLTGMRGNRVAGPGGRFVYQVKDPCSVFERIPGTPKYWQRVRYEIIAKLENIGPFHLFFTLTSGDLRWSANFTPELEKQNCKVHYCVDKFGKDVTTVEVKDGDRTIEKPWQEYLRDHVDEKLHSMMKRNVLLATRNFQHRVETFRKEVIFGRNNPMKVRHISYRVEFQGRGAAHIHGVLWLDLNEIKVEGVENSVLKESYNKLKHSQPLEAYEIRALEKFTDTFVTCTRCISVAGAEAVRIAEETNWHGHSSSCKKGGSGRLCRWKFPRYPLARTIFVDANREYGDEGRMEAKVRDDILDRVMRVLVQEEGGRMVLSDKVKEIMLKYPNVREINGEETSQDKDDALQSSISAERQKQSFSEDPSSQDQHPRTPSPRHYLPDDCLPVEDRISSERSTLQPSFTQQPGSPGEEPPSTPSPRHYLPDDFYQVGNRISSERPPLQPPFPEQSGSPEEEHPSTPSPRHYLPDDFLPVGNRISSEGPTLQQPSNPQPPHLPRKRAAQPLSRYAGPPSKKPKTKANNVTYIKMESPEEYKTNIKKRIEEVLRIASRGGKRITYKMYEKAVVDLPRKGSEVLLQRDIDECFINNYSSEWIVSWDANIDISPVYDYYGTITYITDYFTKVGINI